MKAALKLFRYQWDRTVAVALVLGGLTAVIVAWVLASNTILTFEQIPYLMSGGLIGVCLVAVGATLWLSADLRDEWRKLDRLEEAVLGAGRDEVDATDRSTATATPPSGPRRLHASAES
jgi:formate-dependent nitrite reductase membrane component NrfD